MFTFTAHVTFIAGGRRDERHFETTDAKELFLDVDLWVERMERTYSDFEVLTTIHSGVRRAA